MMRLPDLRSRKPGGLGGAAIAAVLFFTLGLILLPGYRSGDEVKQPIAFNHARHLENGMNCVECHAGAESQIHATLPATDVCAACHQEALGSSPEEQKVVTVAASGDELRWTQVTRVAADVYFSHRRHASVARIDCAECHGPMRSATQPPQRSFRSWSMSACLECHRRSSAGTECNDCHR